MEDFYFIKSRLNGHVLSIKDKNKKPITPIITDQQKKKSTDHQLWYVTSDGLIKSKLNGYLLDVEGSNNAPGTRVISYPKNGENGTANQQWTIENGLIISKLNGNVVTIRGKKPSSGAKIVVRPKNQKHGTLNQLWDLAPEVSTSRELPTPPEVIISHIFYKGEVKRTQSDEYIEITNNGGSPANLAGWRINAGNGGQNFEFPEGTLLQSAQSFRVYTNKIDPETGGFSFGSGRAIWNDNGDEGYLYNADGDMVSHYSY